MSFEINDFLAGFNVARAMDDQLWGVLRREVTVKLVKAGGMRKVLSFCEEYCCKVSFCSYVNLFP